MQTTFSGHLLNSIQSIHGDVWRRYVNAVSLIQQALHHIDYNNLHRFDWEKKPLLQITYVQRAHVWKNVSNICRRFQTQSASYIYLYKSGRITQWMRFNFRFQLVVQLKLLRNSRGLQAMGTPQLNFKRAVLPSIDADFVNEKPIIRRLTSISAKIGTIPNMSDRKMSITINHKFLNILTNWFSDLSIWQVRFFETLVYP